MKPGCPPCREGKCRLHKTSPARKWWIKYGPRRWYWELYALVRGGQK